MKVGILGAGQLGRMLALAGFPLDMTFTFYDTSGSPTANIGKTYIDTDANFPLLDDFLSEVDLVTYEFENIPSRLTRAVEQKKPLFPSTESILVCQNREYEKALFTRLGIPTARYFVVESAEQLKQAAGELGCPVVAKSVTDGYDGKGQAVLKSPVEADAAWQAIGHKKLVVESFVEFKRELSIIAVRGRTGQIEYYPLTENTHHQGILRYSIAPAPELNPQIESLAQQLVKSLVDELDHTGVLTLELFETETGLIANEMAPRVHNSGHWTINSDLCSQFENHLRAIAGLPLGNTRSIRPACMINLIGKTGDLSKILQFPYANLHLYGKAERAGRKIGHITINADTYNELIWRVKNIQSILPDCAGFSCSLID
ncbi:MAG: 5-(carboxyamino)imidazole ribonucleotide synthase [Proteobacteria bacterium]|nr:MAG: 5-(carboxyamino)imidazole ribonucleotide synthase [Pseudomonadota bacterium]PIE40197.1 MAG: 5-(carboxyamino)imidazole ribonucleotide synthase [Gammaproteobacteria bacterium]